MSPADLIIIAMTAGAVALFFVVSDPDLIGAALDTALDDASEDGLGLHDEGDR